MLRFCKSFVNQHKYKFLHKLKKFKRKQIFQQIYFILNKIKKHAMRVSY